MSFRDNLIHLRASHNMTQEQLAMLLGVSRQSVTKWESEKSYPEMDKLLKLCQIFDCTLDDLVQGDLTDRSAPSTQVLQPSGPPVDVFGYDEHMRRFARAISNGVMTIIFGIALSIIFFSMAPSSTQPFVALPENVAAVLGMGCVLGGIALGLALIIPAGMEHSSFVHSHPFIEDFYTAEAKAQARTAFSYQLIGGIVLIFVGICFVIAFSSTAYEDSLGVSLMLGCIAVGVRCIIHGSMMLGRTNLVEYNHAAAEVLESYEIEQASIPTEQKQALMKAQRTDRRISSLCGIIMIAATVIALLLLFWSMAPEGASSGPSWLGTLFWVPWPMGGLLCAMVALAIKGFGKDE